MAKKTQAQREKETATDAADVIAVPVALLAATLNVLAQLPYAQIGPLMKEYERAGLLTSENSGQQT